jgi:DNA-binding NtrC family response regulator
MNPELSHQKPQKMKKKIPVWIIDDEADAQALIKRVLIDYYPEELELLGTSVNIDDAFEQIKHQKPKLVFLDINLPRGSGINLLQRFPFRKFEVIVVSGFPENIDKVQKFGIPFLQKPYSIRDLRNLIDQSIESIKKDPYKVYRYDT